MNGLKLSGARIAMLHHSLASVQFIPLHLCIHVEPSRESSLKAVTWIASIHMSEHTQVIHSLEHVNPSA